jgi:hypothetical protein
MTPEKCPGCGVPLRPDMLACPNCPMSFPEDDGPKGSANPLKQSRFYKFLFPAVFFGTIGATIWYLGTGLMRLGMANNQIEAGNLFGENNAKPAAVAPAPEKPAAADEAAAARVGDARPADAASPDEGEMVIISHVDENGTPIAQGASSKAAKRTALPPPKAPTEWKLRGAVYDLTTLKPLAGCTLLFTDSETNRSVKTRTDSAGRYRAVVRPLDGGKGYDVAVEKSGYAPNYLNPATESVREMAPGQRKELARDLSATLAAAPATISTASEKPLVTDFYLAPRP